MFDIVIIGAGINGSGIARDASGRGLKVCLLDKNRVGEATSSWSTKLIHGGLRYLENYDFKLVRDSLIERENIKKIANPITQDMPFIIPYNKTMRPAWLISLGLFIYDNIGGKTSLEKSKKIKIHDIYPNILKKKYEYGFKYHDLTVDDKKLTKINAINAQKLGAKVHEKTEITKTVRKKDHWLIYLKDQSIIKTKVLINASGPWVNKVLQNNLNINSRKKIRLVRGSHLIVNKIYNEKIALTLQNNDRRIIFVIPYQENYTLIGTTEVDVSSPDDNTISKTEIDYLINSVNKYLHNQISAENIVSTFSGIRPLIDDLKSKASKVTRDYAFDINFENNQAPLLSVYGGKLTTYRKLSENVIDNLSKYFPNIHKKKWTSKSNLF